MKKQAAAVLVCSVISIAVVAWTHFATAWNPTSGGPFAVEVDPVPATAGGNPGIQYTTGFEPEGGFNLGYISNSGGTPLGCGGANFPCWAHVASNASLITPTISDTNPATGLQHLRLIHDPSTRTNQVGFGLGVDARYPRGEDHMARPVAPNTVSVDIAISNPGGMSFRVQPQSPSQGIPATSVLFHYTGEIRIFYGGCDGGIQPTGQYWDTTGAYQNLTISMDPCVPNDEAYGDYGVVDFYYAGDLIYTGCPWGTSLEHLIIFGDNYPGSQMDVDNVVLSSLDECPPTLGACCDTNGADTGCTDNVPSGDCTGADKVWTENGNCADVTCDCIPMCAGLECGPDGCVESCGTCDDGDVCNGSETCNGNGQCDPGNSLNCNDGNTCNGLEICDSASGCTPGTPLNCNDGEFCNGLEACAPATGCIPGEPHCAENETCDEDSDQCVPDVIPTVSQWGLVVLTIILLVAAKVQFGRRRLT